MRRRDVLGLVAGLAAARGAQAAEVQTRRVEGAVAAVEIAWDRWGIPHVTAQTMEDAFFGQGYAAATLRMWQMDLARRRALGRLAVVFGATFVPFDMAARTVAFRGDMAAEWGHHDSGCRHSRGPGCGG